MIAVVGESKSKPYADFVGHLLLANYKARRSILIGFKRTSIELNTSYFLTLSSSTDDFTLSYKRLGCSPIHLKKHAC
jgi:hypothetical protein